MESIECIGLILQIDFGKRKPDFSGFFLLYGVFIIKYCAIW